MSNDEDPYFGAFSQAPAAGAPPQRGPADATQQQPPMAEPPPSGPNQPQPHPRGAAGQPAFTEYYAPDPRNGSPRHDTAGTWLVPVRAGGQQAQDAVVLDKADVKRMKAPAESGLRSYLYNLTRINLGPGKDEKGQLELKERAQRTVRTTFPIAVLNLKGGVGKTVVTKSLGSTLAMVRGGHVIAVDLDNDSGNLTERHGRETHLSIIDLVADLSVGRYLDVRAHTSQDKKSRLEVLGQPNFARTRGNVEPKDFRAAMAILQEYYSLVLLDCGTALKSELIEAVLQASRALLVVTSASIDALRETDETLEWLRYNGYSKLLDTALLIVNHTEPGKPNVVVSKVVEQFSRKIDLNRIFILPFDRHVHEGREITLKLLTNKSRRGYLEIAAALSDLFPRAAD